MDIKNRGKYWKIMEIWLKMVEKMLVNAGYGRKW